MCILTIPLFCHRKLADYQPERPDGTANLHYEPLYFNRCVKFFQRVEIIVALGPPTNDLDKSGLFVCVCVVCQALALPLLM